MRKHFKRKHFKKHFCINFSKEVKLTKDADLYNQWPWLSLLSESPFLPCSWGLGGCCVEDFMVPSAFTQISLHSRCEEEVPLIFAALFPPPPWNSHFLLI